MRETPTNWQRPQLKSAAHKYAQLRDPESPLPPNFSVCLVAGPRASGKTHLVAAVIKSQERIGYVDPDGTACEVRTIVLTPTWDQNPSLHVLRSVHAVHDSYSPEIFREIVDDMRAENARYEAYKKRLEDRKRAPQKRRRPLELQLFENWLEEHPEEEVLRPIVWNLIVDDMLGSRLFKSGTNPFTQFLTRNRHIRCNVWLLVQSLKGVPKTVRANANVLVFFRFGSQSLISDMAEEVAGNLGQKAFESLYNAATSVPHGALCCNFSAPPERRFTRGFEAFLQPEA